MSRYTQKERVAKTGETLKGEANCWTSFWNTVLIPERCHQKARNTKESESINT